MQKNKKQPSTGFYELDRERAEGTSEYRGVCRRCGGPTTAYEMAESRTLTGDEYCRRCLPFQIM